MKRARAPKAPPSCAGMPFGGVFHGARYVYPVRRNRCREPIRPAADISAELLLMVPLARGWAFELEADLRRQYPISWSEQRPRELSDQVDRCAISSMAYDTVTLGMELRGFCLRCAREAAESFLRTQSLVFYGLLSEYRTTGRDERAEEEFELARCAA